jgi:hypothetical protein
MSGTRESFSIGRSCCSGLLHAHGRRHAQIPPDRVFDVAVVIGLIQFKLPGALLELLGVIVRDAKLPEALLPLRRQSDELLEVGRRDVDLA